MTDLLRTRRNMLVVRYSVALALAGLAVKVHAEDNSVPQGELASFVQEAHGKICPYSHATRSNLDVSLEVVGG
jgi:organic hydroperoxide reductase OsmC/OhrA